MNIFKGILVELRERRLWPLAVALLVGLVAVPVLLTKSPSSASGVPATGAPVSPAGQGISVRLASTGAQPGLRGPARDPFTQQAGGSAATASGSAPLSGSGSGSGAVAVAVAAGHPGSVGGGASSGGFAGGSSAFSAGSGGSATVSGGGSSGTPAPSPSPAPSRPAVKPAASGLTSTESYSVALQISNSAGGLNLIDPLERLSPLPSPSQPLLVELGVLQGGQRVLFAVLPGTVVSGAGACTPGPIDCEILSLAPDQTEVLSTQSGGGVTSVDEFAVTGISVKHYPSVAAANAARNAANPVGSNLVANAALPALSLFQYEPSVGAVVDFRNLIVGGN